MVIKNRYRRRVVFFLALSIAITALIYIVGGISYSSNIGSSYHSRIKVELLGLVENTRYSLHFGKDIGTFYRMSEILAKQVGSTPDIDGLYVLDKDGTELFATDGRELSSAVRSLGDDYRVEGGQFYASMYLTEDAGARLVARCRSTQVLLAQSDFFFRFLLLSITGLVLTFAATFFLLHRASVRGELSLFAPAMALFVWITAASGAMHYGLYVEYAESVREIEALVVRSVEADLADAASKGIGEKLLLPLDSYFERYVRAIPDVSAVALDENHQVAVAVSPFAGRALLSCFLETLCFILIAAGCIRFYARRLDDVPEEEGGEETLSPGEGVSIKKRLRFTVLAISATSLIIVSALGIFAMMGIRSESEKAMIDSTKGHLTDIVTDRASTAERHLAQYGEYAAVFAGLAQNPQSLAATVDEVQRNTRTNIFSLYRGDENGGLVIYGSRAGRATPPGYDCRNTEWYSLCKKNRQVIFTDIYEDSFGDGKMVTCAAPIYDGEGNFVGVFGIDILIADLYEELISLDLGENTYAFLLNSKGNVITAEGNELNLQEAEGLDEEAGRRLRSADTVVLERGGIYYTGAKVENTGWTVCIHAPAGSTLSVVRTIDNEIITVIIIFAVIFAVILLIVFGIVTRVAAGITDPIIALSEDVAKISGGNLSHKARIRTHDEIGKLAQSFNAMSGSLAEYIDNVRQMAAEQERISAELTIAADIQASTLPTDFPKREEFKLFASMTPAREVGGDFYDFFFIDREHLGLVMADVSGKGIPAALFMVMAKNLIKNCAFSGAKPAEILRTVNSQLCENNDQFLFVTAWVGILDLRTGRLATADAGHEYPVLRRSGSAKFEFVETEHFAPLGTMEDNDYEEFSLELQSGDTLFLYTDGITDTKNPAGEKLGLKRMQAILEAQGKDDPEVLVDHVRSSLAAFAASAEPFDDVTMMCLTYNS